MRNQAKRRLSIAAAASALFLAAPGEAVTTVLTFPDVSEGGAPACTNAEGGSVNQQCSGGSYVGVNYGTTAQLGVAFNAGGSGTSLVSSTAQFVSGGPLFSGAYNPFAQNLFSTITFTPTAGFEVAFQSLTFFNPSATGGTRFLEVRDALNNLVASDTGAVTNGSFTANTAYFSGPLTFLFRAEGGSFNIDNVTVDTRAIVTPNAVPEPASWAMMLTGFGIVGAGLRRRRGVTAPTCA